MYTSAKRPGGQILGGTLCTTTPAGPLPVAHFVPAGPKLDADRDRPGGGYIYGGGPGWGGGRGWGGGGGGEIIMNL